jgi:hypothetical protein
MEMMMMESPADGANLGWIWSTTDYPGKFFSFFSFFLPFFPFFLFLLFLLFLPADGANLGWIWSTADYPGKFCDQIWFATSSYCRSSSGFKFEIFTF